MFTNFKVVFKMGSPVVTTDFIILDTLLSACKAKEILGDEFYSGKNVYGTKEMIESMLDPIIDKKHGVYCTSIGIGDNREYVSSWTKKWDDKNDDLVNFKDGVKQRVDIGSGHFKNYHMPMVMKTYKDITFYIRGDKNEIERLLTTYISYIGKKGSQGYGQINKMVFEDTEGDFSHFKDCEIMRPIPAENCKDYIGHLVNKNFLINSRTLPTIPPYWRDDYKELCILPQGV